MSSVELRDITFLRQDRVILDAVCWKIEQGQHWALLGANGSGKTTLLRILTGYAWPTSGSVSVFGRRYGQCDLREHRKSIGWVSSAMEHRVPGGDRAVEVVLSGFDASLGIYRPFTDVERAQARRALDLLGGNGFYEQKFETLSQGEQKRTLIARALVHSPSLLVLDEPCAGLDPVNRRVFLQDLAELVARPEAPITVLVTHHVEEIGPWITHVHALRDGKTAATGPVHTVLTSEVMTQVFGEPCTVTRASGEYRLQLG